MNTLATNDIYENIKQIIQRMTNQNLYVCEGYVTSRQLNPPSVKVMLQPFNIETGWIRVGTPYGGPGFGFIALPPDQMTVKVIFDMGDIDSPTIVTSVYNDIDTAVPLNNVDDVILVHKSGSQVYFKSTGEVDISPASGQNIVLNGGIANISRIGDSVSVPIDYTTTDSGGYTVTIKTTLTGTITTGASNVIA